MLKIEDVKVGDELVCIDRDGFTENGIKKANCAIADQEKLVVIDFSDTHLGMAVVLDGNITGVINAIFDNELKYFKKKEQSQYTFDDLIDVAVQAYKDGILSGLSLDDINSTCVRRLSFSGGGVSDQDRVIGDQGDDYKEMIYTIKSLYKETFVIECEEDIKRINIGAKVTLANDLSAKCVSNQTRYFDKTIGLNCGSADDIFGFFALKGAKVEQSKS